MWVSFTGSWRECLCHGGADPARPRLLVDGQPGVDQLAVLLSPRGVPTGVRKAIPSSRGRMMTKPPSHFTDLRTAHGTGECCTGWDADSRRPLTATRAAVAVAAPVCPTTLTGTLLLVSESPS